MQERRAHARDRARPSSVRVTRKAATSRHNPPRVRRTYGFGSRGPCASRDPAAPGGWCSTRAVRFPNHYYFAK
eukprot:7389211-Prymnesium_polylepis.1